ncbi:MAG TPA: DUF4097 family beta strand repeat-containing protein, partial [Pyrinomonadaceae bacterium]|nr:DUF4097 family beta strand repeat-containing protein [Pyrinomonadaceae bacterium]
TAIIPEEVFSQINKTEPKVVVVPKPTPTVAVPPLPPKQPRMTIPHRKRRADNESPAPAEKSIQTEAKVSVSLCVSEGNVRINGWERNEIRAFVSSGSKVGFKVLQKKQNPVWVKVLGFDPVTDTERGLDECLSGSEIELDVPRGAVVALKSGQSRITVESIAKVTVENVGGGITLNNIAGGISAKTYEGDVMVEKSAGAMSLFSTTGNIVAFEVEPSEVGDVFKANTRSGTVTLQAVGHAQVDASSTTGSIRFNGELTSGGQYNFNTNNGSILLAFPAESSCRINANYGFGEFQSEITLKDVQKAPGAQAQRLTATLGAGDANLNLTTYSGAIRIKKK